MSKKEMADLFDNSVKNVTSSPYCCFWKLFS